MDNNITFPKKTRIILWFILLLVLVPYGGPIGLYKTIYGVYFLISTILFAFSLRHMYFNRDKKKITSYFLLQILWLLLSIAVNLFFFNRPFSSSDLGEFSRPLYNLFFFLLCTHFVQTSNEKTLTGIFICLIFISIFNFFLCYAPQTKMEQFEDLISFYGESPKLTYGYAGYRALGIAGQPGKNAALISFVSLGLLFFYQRKGYRTILIVAVLLLNLVSIIFTASRTGLIAFLSIVTLFFVRSTKLNFATLLVLVAVPFAVSYVIDLVGSFYDYDLLFRGLGGDDINTFDKRIFLKKWSLDVITQHPITTIFGTGPSKEYLESFTTSYATDLFLTAPDSSYTLWMLRYGFGGLIVFSLPFFYFFFSRIKGHLKNYDVSLFIFVLFILLQIDPLMHEPKVQIIIWLTLSLFLYPPKISPSTPPLRR